MTLKYGFELEAFYGPSEIGIPPKNYPTDGFPGLVELRSSGGKSAIEAYFDMLKSGYEYNVNLGNLVLQEQHTFSPEEKRELRKRGYVKEADNVQNLYGKKPRALGNKTIASFQINISKEERAAYRDARSVRHPASYNLLDVPKIVRNLDLEFKNEIQNSGRQIGEYCIKDCYRLEYRSLPNSIAKFSIDSIYELVKRIEKAVTKE